jgi:hypothetical protein
LLLNGYLGDVCEHAKAEESAEMVRTGEYSSSAAALMNQDRPSAASGKALSAPLTLVRR